MRSLDPKQLAATLAQQGLTKDGLYARVSDGLTRQQPLRGITASALVPAIATQAALGAWFDQREIQWQRFDAKDYAGAIRPTEAQIQAYYADKAHTAEFTAPEQAKVDFVVLDADALKPQVPVTDELLRQFYGSREAAYTVPQERRASHILINVAPNASPAEVAKAKAQADALLVQLRKNPAGFADAARKNSQDAGSAPAGGDLDFMRKGAIPGAFSDALFSMKQGDISDVVRSDSGFHIIELTAIRGGVAKPFDEVRAQVEDQYRSEQAQKMFAAAAEKFTNTVYEQPDGLEPAIAALKLTRQTAVVQRTPASGAAGPLASARLLAAIFSNEAIKNKHNTEAVETAPRQLTAAHVVDYTPQHMRPLAQVHDQVVDGVRKTQAAAAALKDGQARVAEAAGNPALALPLAATVGRIAPPPEVPRAVIDAALKADIGKGPVVTGVALPDGGYAVMRVVKPVPRARTESEAAQGKSLVEQAFEDAEAEAAYDTLKERYKVKYREDRIAKATAASAPN
ncbi:MAG: peptidylprolyl isomerase [Burkholderiaceae bacterium]